MLPNIAESGIKHQTSNQIKSCYPVIVVIIHCIKLVFVLLQVERDIMIWNNKKFVNKPMFVKSKEDSLIAKHRRWFSQFYSENSPKLKFQKDSLDW